MQFSGSKETGDPIPFLSFKIVWGTLIPEVILFLVQFNNSMVSGTENSISGFSFADLGIFITIKLKFYFFLVTEDQDKVNEEKHIQQALTKCGYPKWTIDKVKRSMKKKKTKTTKRDKNKEKSRGLVVIPYVQGVSESIERSFRKHKVAVSVKPHRTLRSMLVHPKDKTKETEKCEVVYEIGCLNCEDVYIGETGRKIGIRLKEHMKVVESSSSSSYPF